MSKLCPKCKIKKEVSEFCFDASNPSKTGCWCKLCKCESSKLYFQKNKQKKYTYEREYRARNREKVRAIARRATARWRLKNPEASKRYALINAIKVRESRRLRTARRRRCDLPYWLLGNLRRRINRALAGIGAKSAATESLLGCTVPELIIHLESLFKDGMTWQNKGIKGWHIDHIRPCASFDLSDPEQQRMRFHYTNLQPLWWHENISKKDKHEIKVHG